MKKSVKEHLEEALEDTEVFVHIDASHSDVKLPPHLMGGSNVTLKLSFNFRGNLELNEEFVSSDLLFPEGSFVCEFPYSVIWGLTRKSGETIFWPENAPREVLEEMVRGVAGSGDESTEADQKGTKLTAVKCKGDSAPEKQEKDENEAKRKMPSLKRIK